MAISKTRVLVVDDHPILCEGIRSLVSSCDDIQVVGQAPDGQAAVESVAELRPDVVIMDIAMPRMNGIEATRLIRTRYPETRVLILTQHEDQQYVLPLLKAGASGIVLKRALVSDLIHALRTVARGGTFLYPSLAGMVVDEINRRDSDCAVVPRPLTAREKEILDHIVQGETSSEIALALSLSVKTVEFHRANLMNKMGVHRVVDLVREAMRHGLVLQNS